MILDSKLYGKKNKKPIISVNCINGEMNIGSGVVSLLNLKHLDTISFRDFNGKWYVYAHKDGLVAYNCSKESKSLRISSVESCRILSQSLLDRAEKGHLGLTNQITKGAIKYYELIKITK